jgi:hypothetical protein
LSILSDEIFYLSVLSDKIFYLSGTFHVMYLKTYPKHLNQITQLKDTEGYFV